MKVSEVKKKFGKCLELVSMDPNFHDVSVGLFVKNDILTVWSYSRKDQINKRIPNKLEINTLTKFCSCCLSLF